MRYHLPSSGQSFQHSASQLECSARWGWQDVLKSIFSFNTSKTFSSVNCNSWLQVLCGIRPYCSMRRRMVQRIGTGIGVRTEMQAQVPKAWLCSLLSLTYIICGSLVYKCPLVWSGTFVMGWQYNLRPLCSILLSELITSLRNLNIQAIIWKPLRGVGFQAQTFSICWKLECEWCLLMGICKFEHTNS